MKSFDKRVFILLLLFSILMTSGCQSFFSEEKSSKIKIGAIVSLTGAAGEQGTNWLEGVTLAIDDAKEKGVNVSLSIEDDQTQPAKVVSAFNKLVQVDRMQGAIGGTWDFLAEAAFPLAIRHKIPFITPTNPVEILSDTAKESGTIYSNSMTLASIGNTAKSFLVNEHIESLALVFPDLPFGTRQADVIRTLAEDLKIPILFEYAFPPASLMSDTVKLAAQKILLHKPALTFMVIDYNGLDLFTKECELLRIDPKVLTTQHLDQALIFSKEPKRYKNMYALYPPQAKDLAFEEKFVKKHGHKPKVFAQEGYAAAQTLIEMFKAHRAEFAGSSMSVDTILGKYQFPNDQRLLGLGLAQIMSTKSGEFELYRRVE